MLYFVREKGRDRYKIGYTKERSEARIRELQTGNSDHVKPIHIFEGTYEEEQQLHRLFEDYRINGEFFRLDVGKLFAMIVNEELGHRIDVKEKDYSMNAFYRNFLVSKKKPENIHASISDEKFYKHYKEYCKFADWQAMPKQMFDKEIARTFPAGKIKNSGRVFYNAILRDDSLLGD